MALSVIVAEDGCRKSQNKELCTELQTVRRELTDLQKSYTKTVQQHINDLHLLVTTVAKQQQEIEKLSKVAIYL